MERPAEFAGKATATNAEATAYEKHDLTTNNIDDPEAPLLARAGSGRVLRPWAAITTCLSTGDRNWREWMG